MKLSRNIEPTQNARPDTFARCGERIELPGDGEIHTWRIHVTETQAVDLDTACLSDDERARAVRFLRLEDAMSFAATRISLRTLIARYLHTRPHSLNFAYSKAGKPVLLQPAGPQLEFNVSRSGSFSIIAFSTSRAIGVDVERHDDRLNFESIIETVFSADEKLALATVPDTARRKEFFRYWTRKEAFLKCLGVGLSEAPESCTVTPFCPTPVFVQELGFNHGYSAAVAAMGGISCVVANDFEWASL